MRSLSLILTKYTYYQIISIPLNSFIEGLMKGVCDLFNSRPTRFWFNSSREAVTSL